MASALGEAGFGGHGGHSGGRLDLTAAATALAMSVEELRTALGTDGTSLADVAQDQGVDVDTLVEALVQAGEDRIARAVEDGRIPQDEADGRLADLEGRITERVDEEAPGRGGDGRGDHGWGSAPR